MFVPVKEEEEYAGYMMSINSSSLFVANICIRCATGCSCLLLVTGGSAQLPC